MHIPRRHSRRLLLPPGWVALGFLLLLGCQALLAHRQQISVYHKLELAMPIPENMSAKTYHTPYVKAFTKPLADIKPATRWSIINLNGRKLHDFVNSALVATAVQGIDADATQAAGVKICFQTGATYSNVIAMLDLVNRLDHPRYWLDVEHQPTAFYAVNSKAVKPIREEGLAPKYVPFCISPVLEKYEPPIPIPTFWQVAQQDFADLWQQPWRLTAMLIASIAALSIYRLARPRSSLR
jgi:hypothetical protein